MKYVKMLGLAAVAAAALMAFVGAGTASAATICSTTVDPCPAGQAWPDNTAVDFSTEPTEKAVLSDTSGFVQNQCESTVQGTLTNNSKDDPTLSGLTITWTGCTRTTANVKIGTLTIDAIAGSHNGTVTAATEFQVTSKVPGFFGEVSCVFKATAGQSLGTLTESTATKAPTMDVETVVTPIAGQSSECPATARWKGHYVLTIPASTQGYVTS